MTYHLGVGVDSGGQFAQNASGAAERATAPGSGRSPVEAGRQAFSERGLGCAFCHGDHAQGLRGPRLAGGVELADLRHVHGGGLFPPSVVSDRDVATIDAWLRTLGSPGSGER